MTAPSTAGGVAALQRGDVLTVGPDPIPYPFAGKVEPGTRVRLDRPSSLWDNAWLVSVADGPRRGKPLTIAARDLTP